MIRDFTEHMWRTGPWQAARNPLSYFLSVITRTHPVPVKPGSCPRSSTGPSLMAPPVQHIGNDEWYAYMNGDRQIFNDFPDIMVGRLSVRNGTTAQTDTLSAIIDNIIDLEDPITTPPVTDNRRRILRLAGTGQNDSSDTGIQYYRNWGPEENGPGSSATGWITITTAITAVTEGISATKTAVFSRVRSFVMNVWMSSGQGQESLSIPTMVNSTCSAPAWNGADRTSPTRPTGPRGS